MKGYDFTFEITADMIHKLNLRTTHLLVFALLVVTLLMGSYGMGYNASSFIYNQF